MDPLLVSMAFRRLGFGRVVAFFGVKVDEDQSLIPISEIRTGPDRVFFFSRKR